MRILSLKCSFFLNTYAKSTTKSVPLKALFDGSLGATKLPKGTMDSRQLDQALASHVAKHGKDEAYTNEKTWQCALTPSAVFKGPRNLKSIKTTNPILVVDFDDCPSSPKDVEAFKAYPWVVGAGQSTSRRGIFVVVHTATKDLKGHFAALQALWPTLDPLKDLTRLRYLSYGHSWCREPSEAFTGIKAVEPVPELSSQPPTTEFDTPEDLDQLFNYVGEIESLHPWEIRLAMVCNQRGISRDYGRREAWQRIKDLPIIKDTPRYTQGRFNKEWNAVYREYAHQHHSERIQPKVSLTARDLKRFGPSLYSRAPKAIQELLETVALPEEKEVVFFSSLVLLGLLFPNRYTRYFNNNYFCNLYGYVIGDAASFKGKAKILRTALRHYQSKIHDVRKSQAENRKAVIAANKADKANKQEVPRLSELSFFFDGNTSSAAMLTAMQDSPLMCLFETEGDTITKTWSNDWGNYSDILRKAFEHEVLNSFKKGSGQEGMERIYVESPRLSVLVSSTQGQMRKILSADETENGLLSRFLFYIVQNDGAWHNGFLDNHTEMAIAEILPRWVSVEAWYSSFSREPIFYSVSDQAMQAHQEYFKYINDNWPEDLKGIISVTRRAGPGVIRLALLFEGLFELERSHQAKGLVARSHTIGIESMQLALDIMNILLGHVTGAWQTTKRTIDKSQSNVLAEETKSQLRRLWRESPKLSVRDAARQIGVSKTSVSRHKKSLKNEGLFD